MEAVDRLPEVGATTVLRRASPAAAVREPSLSLGAERRGLSPAEEEEAGLVPDFQAMDNRAWRREYSRIPGSLVLPEQAPRPGAEREEEAAGRRAALEFHPGRAEKAGDRLE